MVIYDTACGVGLALMEFLARGSDNGLCLKIPRLSESSSSAFDILLRICKWREEHVNHLRYFW